MTIRFSTHKIRWFLLFVIILAWGFIWILEVSLENSEKDRCLAVSGELPLEYRVNLFDRRKPTAILLYFKEDGRGYTTLDDKYFIRMKCPVRSCVVTTNRSYLPDITDFDVVIFSHRNIRNGFRRLPTNRTAKQNYILYLEQPSENDCLTHEFVDFFNMTMSYRFDADIQHHNGRFLSKETHQQIAPDRRPQWGKIPRKPRMSKDILKNVQNKTKLAAWITKECSTRTGPMTENLNLIRSLQAHFRIDFAGPCGDVKCYSFVECLELIEKDYKFLIQIEDVFALDYISSDTFYLFRYTVVPILFGTVRYQKFFPTKSYINADSFSSPKLLGDTVHRLDQNIIEYTMHFWWKSLFYVQSFPNYCDLCAKTRKLRMSNRTKYYRNLNLWLDPFEDVEEE